MLIVAVRRCEIIFKQRSKFGATCRVLRLFDNIRLSFIPASSFYGKSFVLLSRTDNVATIRFGTFLHAIVLC